jgi:hypothetical protein
MTDGDSARNAAITQNQVFAEWLVLTASYLGFVAFVQQLFFGAALALSQSILTIRPQP